MLVDRMTAAELLEQVHASLEGGMENTENAERIALESFRDHLIDLFGDPDDARMPLYQCHKRVRAAKIIHETRKGPGGIEIITDSGFIFNTSKQFVEKHALRIGDYLVQYEDGYMSVSPAEVFNKGYTKL